MAISLFSAGPRRNAKQITNPKFQNLEKILPEIQKDILLEKYTTLKIGGPAKYFIAVSNKEDLIKAVRTAQKLRLSFFVLGGGSNMLVSDKGYNGLVISFQFAVFNFQKSKIIAGAGTPFGRLAGASAERGLTGLEWAVGVPGTVGGAVYGNAGAFGKSMKDIIEEVEVLDIKDLRFKIYDLGKCKFGYRESVFKKKKNLIIISAVLKLKKGKKQEIRKKIKECLNYKRETQPLNYPSVGSIFKNPLGKTAGFLIEECGLKGKRVGRAQISEKHANFIINLGNAKAKDVKKLINFVKNKVKKKFGVLLDEEVQYVGFRN